MHRFLELCFFFFPIILLLAAIVLLILFLVSPKGSKRRKAFAILSAVFAAVGIILISLAIFFAVLLFGVVSLM